MVYLMEKILGCPIQDAPDRPEEGGQGLVIEDDDHCRQNEYHDTFLFMKEKTWNKHQSKCST